MTVSEGDTFEVVVIGGPATFTVGDVDHDTVRFESDESFSVVRNGRTSLFDTETGFEVARPGSTELSTPTMDADTTVTLDRLRDGMRGRLSHIGGAAGQAGDNKPTPPGRRS